MSERAFLFWQRWLLAASALFCAFGLFVALLPNAALLAPWNAAVAEAFYAGAEPEGAAGFRAFVLGPLGGTIAGFYLLQAFVARYPFAERRRWAWGATAGSHLLWFVTDSSLSLGRGAAFNVWMINLAPLVAFGLPLGMTWRAFFGRSATPPRPPVAAPRSPSPQPLEVSE
jgi:hypothetical protein